MTDVDPPTDGICQQLVRLHPALLLLAGSNARAGEHDGRNLGRVWLVLGLAGVTWGAVLAGLWSLGSILFGPYQILPFTRVALVLLAMGLGPFRRGLFALGEFLGDSTSSAQATVAAMIVCVLALCLLGITRDDPSPALPAYAAWMRPDVAQRVLVLMPMWGIWAMMVTGHFCRPAKGACRLATSFVRNQPVSATAFWLAAPLALTLWYFNFMGPISVVPAATALVVASAGGVALCRSHGGANRKNLLGANMATQLAFLLGYLCAKGLAP